MTDLSSGVETNGVGKPKFLKLAKKRYGHSRGHDDLYELYSGWGITRNAPLACKMARMERIKAHIAAYPGKSICFPEAGQ